MMINGYVQNQIELLDYLEDLSAAELREYFRDLIYYFSQNSYDLYSNHEISSNSTFQTAYFDLIEKPTLTLPFESYIGDKDSQIFIFDNEN